MTERRYYTSRTLTGGCSMSLHPYRLVTLLELLELSGEAFCRLSSVIGQSLVVLRNAHDFDVAGLGGTLGELMREAERLKLTSVFQQLERMKEHLTDGKATHETLRQMMVALYDRMRDELESRVLLTLATESGALYRQSSPIFGVVVEAKFPQMSEDISEAAKCLALNRSTASVFHLMRVMEIGVQRFGDDVGVLLTTEKVWQNILDGINAAIKAMDQKSPKTKAYAAASANLYNVKIAWRNEVMHPKQTYTLEEAQSVFASTKIFISDLAGLI